MSRERISVGRGQYRRVLLEAICNLEALMDANNEPQRDDVELLAWCREELRRVGGEPGQEEGA